MKLTDTSIPATIIKSILGSGILPHLICGISSKRFHPIGEIVALIDIWKLKKTYEHLS